MRISKKIDRWIYWIVIHYHFIYILFATFLPSLTNKLALVMLILLFFFYNKKISVKSKIHFFTINILFIFYCAYTVFCFGTFQLQHSDYYTFWLLIFALLVYSSTEIRKDFLKYFTNHEQQYKNSTIGFFVILLISLFIKNGLHTGFGTTIPILYGPYSVPHILAYSLLGVYCGLSIVEKHDSVRWVRVLKMISAVCVVWTAARSAVLGLAILIAVDYFKIKRIKKKAVVAFIVIVVFLYLLLFTDLVYNNPLMQKTLKAIENGSVTNGRERFSTILMTYYNTSMTVLQKILGIGMNNVRQVMKNSPGIGVAIHAHNDYINALCGYGILGLGIFVVAQFKLIEKNKVFFGIMLLLFMFVLAYFNGLSMYSSFTPTILLVLLFFYEV